MKRTRSKHRSLQDVGAAVAWHDAIVAMGCEICPRLGEACEGAVQAHHVLRSQFIRGWVAAEAHEQYLTQAAHADLERELLWDLRNGQAVCYRAHRRHHNRVQPIPLWLVPLDALRFAEQLGLAHRVEADYLSSA